MSANGKTVLHYFIELTVIQHLLCMMSHRAPWKATTDRFIGPPKQSGREIINNDNLACFQVTNWSFWKVSCNFVVWSVKMTPVGVVFLVSESLAFDLSFAIHWLGELGQVCFCFPLDSSSWGFPGSLPALTFFGSGIFQLESYKWLHLSYLHHPS